MDDNRRRSARELAEARHRLRWHVLVYVLVNSGLVVIWWTTGMGFFWPVLPIFFWGIGVAAHYVSAYRAPGSEWVDRETERILRERGEEVGRR